LKDAGVLRHLTRMALMRTVFVAAIQIGTPFIAGR
jgi:hypothetical protein